MSRLYAIFAYMGWTWFVVTALAAVVIVPAHRRKEAKEALPGFVPIQKGDAQ